MSFPIIMKAVNTEAAQFISKLKLSLTCTFHQIGFSWIEIIFKYSEIVSFPSGKFGGIYFEVSQKGNVLFEKSNISTL